VLEQVEKQTGKKPMTARPADLLEPGMEKYRKQCAEKNLPTDDETVVLFAMFPQQVEALLKKPAGASVPTVATTTAPSAAPAPAVPAPAASPAATTRASNGSAQRLFVTVNGKRHSVTVETLEG
jgi:pyruvate/oxaloacetate carboxyltransferase